MNPRSTIFLLLAFSYFRVAFGASNVLNVAIILSNEEMNGAVELGYTLGIKSINSNKSILPDAEIVGKSIYFPKNNSFILWKTLCNVNGNLISIFGSGRDTWVEGIAQALPIPIFTSVQSFDKNDDKNFKLHPSLKDWGNMIRSLVKFLEIRNIAIIYEGADGLRKMQAILRTPGTVDNVVIVRRVTRDTYVEVLKEVKRRKIETLIMDCEVANLPTLLKAIETLQMSDYKYHYILTNLDLGVFNMSGFIRANVNLTSFNIVDQSQRFPFPLQDISPIQTETALAYDSIMILGRALSATQEIHPLNISCKEEMSRGNDSTLFKNMMAVNYDGITGPIKFKEGNGHRSTKFDIVRLGSNGLLSIGNFYEGVLNISKPQSFWDDRGKNDTLIVACIVSTPYVMIRNNESGNSKFEGFSVDVLKVVAEHIGFKYIFEEVPDGKYGAYNAETGEWNGVIRHLMDKNVIYVYFICSALLGWQSADLAIGAITINYAREKVIDFSKPFMNMGISILFKVPEKRQTPFFGFLKPLAGEIWFCIVASYLLVSLTIFIVARFSPKGNIGNQVFRERCMNGCNQFTIANAFWYPVGTLMQQGSDLNPKTISTRIVAGFFWFFSLVIISSYTANLAAFLTCERMSTPIESADDLAEQSDISYGAVESGSTLAFFKGSRVEPFKKMWRFMESRVPSSLVHSYEEGVERVLQGNYAFLMESASLDYAVKQNCNLTQIGGLLDSKGFGIAMPKVARGGIKLVLQSSNYKKKVLFKFTTISGGRMKRIATKKRCVTGNLRRIRRQMHLVSTASVESSFSFW